MAYSLRGQHPRLRVSTTPKDALIGCLGATSVVAASLFALKESVPAVALALALFGTMGAALASLRGPAVFRLFIAVYCCSVLATVALYFCYLGRYGAPYYVGGSDDLAYETSAAAVAERLGALEYGQIRGNVVPEAHNSVGYVYLVSLLYRTASAVGGFHTLVPRLLNSLVLGWIAVLTYELSRDEGLSPRFAGAAALYVGLAPVMLYAAAHTFRDIVTSFLTLFALHAWRRRRDDRRRGRFVGWICTILIAALLTQLRLYQAYIPLAVALTADFASALWPPRSTIPSLLRLAMPVVLCLALLVAFRGEIAGLATRLSTQVGTYSSYRVGLSDGLSAYVFRARPPLSFVLRALYALVSPIPILSTEPERLFLSAGTVLQFSFLPFLGLGLLRAVRDPSRWYLLVAFLLLFAGFALVSFTWRHLTQVIPVAAVLAATGYPGTRRRALGLSLLMGWMGIALIGLYAVAKV